MSQDIDGQQARRDALVPSIPTSLFRKYDTIRSRRAGVGLSLVREGSCVSCHMRLPPQLYNVLQRADSVEQCPSCFRVIFWETLLQNNQAKAAVGTPKKAPAERKKAKAVEDEAEADAPGASV